MRTRKIRILFVVVAACLSTSCDQVPLLSNIEKGDQSGLPADRTLVDARGRELEVRVIGRDADGITFLRSSDNRKFHYAIADLSERDRKWAESLPISTGGAELAVYTSSRDQGDGLSFDEAALQEIEREIEKSYDQLYDLPTGSVTWRSLRSHVKRLKNRRGRLLERTR